MWLGQGSEHRRSWSACGSEQPDQDLRCSHMTRKHIHMTRLIFIPYFNKPSKTNGVKWKFYEFFTLCRTYSKDWKRTIWLQRMCFWWGPGRRLNKSILGEVLVFDLARGYKTFFMLNSAEHEFFFLLKLAFSYLLAEKFSSSVMFSKKEFGIISNLRFISMKKFMLSWVRHEKKVFITSRPGLSILLFWVNSVYTCNRFLYHATMMPFSTRHVLSKCWWSLVFHCEVSQLR